MKAAFAIMGVSLMTILSGCISPPRTSVATAPVGPNPIAPSRTSPQGGLEVFSRWSARSDDQNQESTYPGWNQHTDYYLCDSSSKVLKRIFNVVGHYGSDPRTVHLPPGRYTVEAQSAPDYWVRVPVTIENGKITRVHLDGTWNPPGYADKSQVVTMPNGRPIGWKM